MKIRFHLKSKSSVESLLLVHFNIGFATSPELESMSAAQLSDWVKNQSKLKQRYHPIVISTGIKVITVNWNQDLQQVAGDNNINTRLQYIANLGEQIFAELAQSNELNIVDPAQFKQQFNLRYVVNNSINSISSVKEKKKTQLFDPALASDFVSPLDIAKTNFKSEADRRLNIISNSIFTEFWKNKINGWIEEKTISSDSKRNYISSVQTWLDFESEIHNGKKFIIGELDKFLIREYVIFITNKKAKKKKYSDEFEGYRLGTISKHKTRLKKILSELMIEEDIELPINLQSKILEKKTEKTEDVALSEIEIQKIYKADLSVIESPSGYRGSIGFKSYIEELEFYRNCFILGIISGGCRVSDLKRIKDIRSIGENKYKLVYKSEKTEFDVELILPDYYLSIFNSVKKKLPLLQESRYNKLLRLIGFAAGLTDEIYIHITNPSSGKVEQYKKPIYSLISTHTARRTFISIMYSKGMPPIDIMELAGIGSIQTLENYIKARRRTIKAESIQLD